MVILAYRASSRPTLAQREQRGKGRKEEGGGGGGEEREEKEVGGFILSQTRGSHSSWPAAREAGPEVGH